MTLRERSCSTLDLPPAQRDMKFLVGPIELLQTANLFSSSATEVLVSWLGLGLSILGSICAFSKDVPRS